MSQFPHVGIEPSRSFANDVSGGLGSPVLRVTRRAQSAYLRPSDLSCCFLPVADPGGARARLYPRLLEGGAGEARGGAREGRDPGPRFRGDRGSAASRSARTRTGTTRALRRQVGKIGSRGSFPTFLNFLFGPALRKGPGVGGSRVLPFYPPPPGQSVDAGGVGIPECPDLVPSNFPRPGTFGLCLQVSAFLGSPA